MCPLMPAASITSTHLRDDCRVNLTRPPSEYVKKLYFDHVDSVKDLSEDDKARVMGTNAAALLGIEVPAA